MPNTESAKKRMKQDEVRHARNLWRKRRVKEQVKAFLQSVHDKDVNKAEEEFRKTVAVLDKVASTSTMHKNTAARRKSRLSKRLAALRQGA